MSAETKKSNNYIVLIRTDDQAVIHNPITKLENRAGDEKEIMRYSVTPAEHLNLTGEAQMYQDSGYISTFDLAEIWRSNTQNSFFTYTNIKRYVHFIVIPREAYREIIAITGESRPSEDHTRMVNSGNMLDKPIFNSTWPQIFSTSGVNIQLRDRHRTDYEMLLGGNWQAYALCRSYTAATAERMMNIEFLHLTSDEVAHRILHTVKTGENLEQGEKERARTIGGAFLEEVELLIQLNKALFARKCEPFKEAAEKELKRALEYIKRWIPEILSDTNFIELSMQIDQAIVEISKTDIQHNSIDQVKRSIQKIQKRIIDSSVMMDLTEKADAAKHAQIIVPQRKKELEELHERIDQVIKKADEVNKRKREEKTAASPSSTVNPLDLGMCKWQAIFNIANAIAAVYESAKDLSQTNEEQIKEFGKKQEPWIDYLIETENTAKIKTGSDKILTAIHQYQARITTNVPSSSSSSSSTGNLLDLNIVKWQAISQIANAIAAVYSFVNGFTPLSKRTKRELENFEQNHKGLIDGIIAVEDLPKVKGRLDKILDGIAKYKERIIATIAPPHPSGNIPVSERSSSSSSNPNKRSRNLHTSISHSSNPTSESMDASAVVMSPTITSTDSPMTPLAPPTASLAYARAATTSTSSNTGIVDDGKKAKVQDSDNNPSARKKSGGFNPYALPALRSSSRSQANSALPTQLSSSSQLTMIPTPTASSVPFAPLSVPNTALNAGHSRSQTPSPTVGRPTPVPNNTGNDTDNLDNSDDNSHHL